MKILKLTAENFKRLHAVEITPNGNMVEITGKNGAGKTSVLDALWATLAGASVVQPAPIRTGEKEARIRLDLGELVVTRTFKRQENGEATTAITVQNAEGARFPSPQRMLDELLGALTFDPLEFARMDPKAQFNALRRFVPGVDFDALEEQHATDYAQRTEVNRQAKAARTLAAAIIVPDASPDEMDEHALMDELQRALEANAEADKLEQHWHSDQQTVQRLANEATALRAQADRLEREAAELGAGLTVPTDVRIDVPAIRARIERAHTASIANGRRAERVRLITQALELEARSLALTTGMEACEQAKRDAIAAAKMPVDGLDLGAGVVLMHDVPFEQASDAEKLRASAAIAMAGNPKLRVLRIRDGSLLDSTSLALIADMATEKDYQVWIERVEESGSIGFVIEDGSLKGAK